MTDAEWEKLKRDCEIAEATLHVHGYDGRLKAIDQLIEYCESLREAQRWRKVEDELPESGHEYLVNLDHKDVIKAFYAHHDWYPMDHDGNAIGIKITASITHFRQLPKGPEEES